MSPGREYVSVNGREYLVTDAAGGPLVRVRVIRDGGVHWRRVWPPRWNRKARMGETVAAVLEARRRLVFLREFGPRDAE